MCINREEKTRHPSFYSTERKERKHVCVSFSSDDSFPSYDRLTNVDTYANRRGLQIIQKHCQKNGRLRKKDITSFSSFFFFAMPFTMRFPRFRSNDISVLSIDELNMRTNKEKTCHWYRCALLFCALTIYQRQNNSS